MMKRMVLLAAIVAIQIFSLPAYAGEEENKLMAVFFSRFSSYIELPDRSARKFVITLIDENPFGEFLNEFYRNKTISGKPVEIHLVNQSEEIGQTDILFVTLENPRARQAAIDYAQKNSILTISQAKGFAERGGIIQLDFLQQGTRIKINHDAAVKSKLRIAAPLLALATVVKGEMR